MKDRLHKRVVLVSDLASGIRRMHRRRAPPCRRLADGPPARVGASRCPTPLCRMREAGTGHPSYRTRTGLCAPARMRCRAQKRHRRPPPPRRTAGLRSPLRRHRCIRTLTPRRSRSQRRTTRATTCWGSGLSISGVAPKGHRAMEAMKAMEAMEAMGSWICSVALSSTRQTRWRRRPWWRPCLPRRPSRTTWSLFSVPPSGHRSARRTSITSTR